MFFNIILSIAVGLILFFVVRNKKDFEERIFRSGFIAIILFFASLTVSQILFEPLFNLKTYCESEPRYEIGLVSVGEKFVAKDGECYSYCSTSSDPYVDYRSILSSDEKNKVLFIGRIWASDEAQIEESYPPYASTGVMKIYFYQYTSKWSKFFFSNPGTQKRIFSIPKGTLGKGKIIIPDPWPVYVPAID